MSEGGVEGAFGGAPGGPYPSEPTTPSSTVPDPGDKSGLPPFSSFTGTEVEGPEPGGRLLDISSGWDYYGEGLSGRLIDRGEGFSMLVPQYRPWESKEQEAAAAAAKLPSFQSQFTAFPDSNGETVSLTTLTPAAPSPSLPGFQTLGSVPAARGYPLVPAPVQAREIPGIQQQLLDERHIHLYSGQQYYQPQQQILTVVKTEPLIVTQLGHYQSTPHEIKTEDAILDSRKKERRKIRASSLESSTESDGVGSSSVESSGQVAAISSTAGFKSPLIAHQVPHHQPEDDCSDMSDKPVKKKRKRCGECIGCQRKDNCGDCAPCRNDKSHQICKMRRCEKLTDKKHLLYLNQEFPRSERGRGRGKGRGGGSYRKVSRGSPATQTNLQLNGSVDNMMTTMSSDHSTRETKVETPTPVPQSPLPTMQTGGVMPLYSGVQPGLDNGSSFTTPIREHRFPNSVWHQTSTPTDPAIAAWTPQGQFIQQIPVNQVEELRYTQYGITGYPQATPVSVTGYQQTSFMQTNGTASYNGTGGPQPSPHGIPNGTSRSTPTLNGNMEYVDQSPRPSEYINGNYTHSSQEVMAPPGSTTPTSRCGSAHLESSSDGKYTNPPTPSTPAAAAQGGASNGNQQGNGIPGYPHQPPPQQTQSSHNSSGYPGQDNESTQSGKVGEAKHPVAQEVWSGGSGQSGSQSNQSSQNQPISHTQPLWPSEGSTRADGSQVHPKQQDIWSGNNAADQQTVWSNAEQNSGRNASVQGLWKTVDSENNSGANGGTQDMWPKQEEKPIAQHHQPQQQQDMWTINNPDAHAKTPTPTMWASSDASNQNAPPEQWASNPNSDINAQNSKSSPSKNPYSSGQDVWPQQQQQHQMWTKDNKQQSSQQQQQEPYPERAELNNRLKSMILNKQFQEGRRKEDSRQSMYPDQKPQTMNNAASHSQSGHFLVDGHHPQDLVSEGGGAWEGWNPHKYFNNHLMPMPVPNLPQPISQPQPLPHNNDIKQLQNLVNYCSNGNSDGHYQSMSYYESNKEGQSQMIRGDQQIKENNQTKEMYNNDWHLQNSNNVYIKEEPQPIIQPQHNINNNEQWEYPRPPVHNQAIQEPSIQQEQDKYGNDPRIDEPVQVKDELDGSIKTIKANYAFFGDGGPVPIKKVDGPWCCRQGGTEKPSAEHLKEGCCQGQRTLDELLEADREIKKEEESVDMSAKPTDMSPKEYLEHLEKLRNNVRTEVPSCKCFPTDTAPPEPGSYYTHLGAAASLVELRESLESRTGFKGKSLRFEKILYTGKEGKTTSGCPLAKWIIRRSSLEEKLLVVVKQRKGHTCSTAWIVVVMVAWEGIPAEDADIVYSMLTYKLNKFGLPTTRRCATNEPRTCACQGLDPESSGSSYSFGCSWSMYYNGCKYARSKNVRKFRLSVKSEETEVEDRMQDLATHIAPLYQAVAPESYKNMTHFENEASECRLGKKPGRPFSGVTACVDFCAHSHRDLHNMNNGCTAVVSLTKHRTLDKPDDEQYHVLPLYVMDETDEFGTKEGQAEKVKAGALENLTRFPCEVRVRAVPLTPCRRQGKKRKDDEETQPKKTSQGVNTWNVKSEFPNCVTPDQLQSSQVSSTVVDSPSQCSCPGFYSSEGCGKGCPPSPQRNGNYGQSPNGMCKDRKVFPDSTSIPNNDPAYYQYNQDRLYNTARFPPTPQSPHSTNHCSPTDSESKEGWGCSPKGQAVFRVPKGRPPSRQSNPSTPVSPVEPTYLRPNWEPQQERVDRGTSTSNGNGFSRSNAPPHLAALQEHVHQTEYSWNKYPQGQNYQEYGQYPCNYQYQQQEEPKGIKQEPYEYGYSKAPPIKQEPGWGYQAPPPPPPPTYFHYPPVVQEPHYPPYQNDRYWAGQGQGAFPHAAPPLVPPAPHYPYQGVGEGYQFPRWNNYGPNPYLPSQPEQPKAEPIGHVSEFADNEECFKDSQMGGVAIALGHGSVLFECAKHELHATTALRCPNRKHPARISLVFYQHRNLNRASHGCHQWEEKMRTRKLAGMAVSAPPSSFTPRVAVPVLKSGTQTTTTWTTLFPMHPCIVTGPYQESEDL